MYPMLEVLTRCRRLGGGVAIVLSFLLAVLLAAILGAVKPDLATGILGAGIGIALLGFLDDHGHIAARWRLLGHFAGACWLLYWLGGLPALAFFGLVVDLGWVGHIAAAFYLVWMLNLYNFMDGIDGIASVEAVCVCVGAALLVVVSGVGSDEASQGVWLAALLAAAVTGFLFWNFLLRGSSWGMLVAVSWGYHWWPFLQAAWVSPQLFWGWLILLGVFIVDATLTLLRRLLRETRFMRRIAVTHTSMLLVITGVIFLLPWQWEASTSSGCCHWHCLSQRGRSTACLLC